MTHVPHQCRPRHRWGCKRRSAGASRGRPWHSGCCEGADEKDIECTHWGIAGPRLCGIAIDDVPDEIFNLVKGVLAARSILTNAGVVAEAKLACATLAQVYGRSRVGARGWWRTVAEGDMGTCFRSEHNAASEPHGCLRHTSRHAENRARAGGSKSGASAVLGIAGHGNHELVGRFRRAAVVAGHLAGIGARDENLPRATRGESQRGEERRGERKVTAAARESHRGAWLWAPSPFVVSRLRGRKSRRCCRHISSRCTYARGLRRRKWCRPERGWPAGEEKKLGRGEEKEKKEKEKNETRASEQQQGHGEPDVLKKSKDAERTYSADGAAVADFLHDALRLFTAHCRAIGNLHAVIGAANTVLLVQRPVAGKKEEEADEK